MLQVICPIGSDSLRFPHIDFYFTSHYETHPEIFAWDYPHIPNYGSAQFPPNKLLELQASTALTDKVAHIYIFRLLIPDAF